jgi:hypothetical protein
MPVQVVDNYLSRCPPGTYIFFKAEVGVRVHERPLTCFGIITERYVIM